MTQFKRGYRLAWREDGSSFLEKVSCKRCHRRVSPRGTYIGSLDGRPEIWHQRCFNLDELEKQGVYNDPEALKSFEEADRLEIKEQGFTL